MLCLMCGASMETRRENFHYTSSGLPHVTLRQIEVSRCPQCGETEVSIPRIEALHRAIAKLLVQQRTRLVPEEIRFLRKYLGWSGTDFAAHMGVTPETVSRWENGAAPMSSTAERLLRLLVVHIAPVQDYSADLLAAIAEESAQHSMYLGLDAEKEDWYEAALAMA